MTALRCSFCNRTANEVGRIISVPNRPFPAHICNECVEVCVGILQDGAGEVDVCKRFKQRQAPYSPHFMIPVLISMCVAYSVWGYYEGGASKSKELFFVSLTATVIALLVRRWLRRPEQVNK